MGCCWLLATAVGVVERFNVGRLDEKKQKDIIVIRKNADFLFLFYIKTCLSSINMKIPVDQHPLHPGHGT